ncbi:MAG: TA system VapC family ribonuclease toxin [Terriglobales bacterium]
MNVLVAQAWPNHTHHRLARLRLEQAGAWATCSLTELAFLRLSSTRAANPTAVSLADAAHMLELMLADRRHHFLADLPSPLDARLEVEPRRLTGPGQLTDAYLLRLARRHKATLLSLDRRMAPLAYGDELEILDAVAG